MLKKIKKMSRKAKESFKRVSNKAGVLALTRRAVFRLWPKARPETTRPVRRPCPP